jgi:hypothetical protein
MGDGARDGDAGRKGKGVFARRDFQRGELILRFQGRVAHSDAVPDLTPWEQEHPVELTEEMYQLLPPPRCYLNHSCAPNAVSTSDTVYAWRHLAAGGGVDNPLPAQRASRRLGLGDALTMC